MRFNTSEDRDHFARRLHDLAVHMLRSCDQGHDGRITVNDEMIDDIRAAAAIVATTPVTDQIEAVAAFLDKLARQLASGDPNELTAECRAMAKRLRNQLT